MAWLAVNKDGTEWIMPEKPVRGRCGHWEYLEEVYNVPILFSEAYLGDIAGCTEINR